MDGSCLGNDTSSHCLASIYNIYSVCVAEASSYSEIAQASSYSYADRALELGKSAATWQLVVALYVALLVLRMHGRFILWSWLTMLLFFLHALYVFYQFTIVAVNITLVSAQLERELAAALARAAAAERRCDRLAAALRDARDAAAGALEE